MPIQIKLLQMLLFLLLDQLIVIQAYLDTHKYL